MNIETATNISTDQPVAYEGDTNYGKGYLPQWQRWMTQGQGWKMHLPRDHTFTKQQRDRYSVVVYKDADTGKWVAYDTGASEYDSISADAVLRPIAEGRTILDAAKAAAEALNILTF